MIKITAKTFAERTGMKVESVYMMLSRRKVSLKDTHAVLDILREYENKIDPQK